MGHSIADRLTRFVLGGACSTFSMRLYGPCRSGLSLSNRTSRDICGNHGQPGEETIRTFNWLTASVNSLNANGFNATSIYGTRAVRRRVCDRGNEYSDAVENFNFLFGGVDRDLSLSIREPSAKCSRCLLYQAEIDPVHNSP